MSENERYQCRICLDDECTREDVIAPCACKGSAQWVHRNCLNQWRATREDRAFSRCTECLQDFKLIAVVDDHQVRTYTHTHTYTYTSYTNAYVNADVAHLFSP